MSFQIIHLSPFIGPVLVQLHSGNVDFLGPLSLEKYQLHQVQHFNIQGKIYTFVNNSLQHSSESMRQLSMSLPIMTNLSNHSFEYVPSTAVCSEPSSRQRSCFSVLKQLMQASRLQQQLRLFLQDGHSFSQHSHSVNEVRDNNTESWEIFFQRCPSSPNVCYRPVPRETCVVTFCWDKTSSGNTDPLC